MPPKFPDVCVVTSVHINSSGFPCSCALIKFIVFTVTQRDRHNLSHRGRVQTQSGSFQSKVSYCFASNSFYRLGTRFDFVWETGEELVRSTGVSSPMRISREFVFISFFWSSSMSGQAGHNSD